MLSRFHSEISLRLDLHLFLLLCPASLTAYQISPESVPPINHLHQHPSASREPKVSHRAHNMFFPQGAESLVRQSHQCQHNHCLPLAELWVFSFPLNS